MRRLALLLVMGCGGSGSDLDSLDTDAGFFAPPDIRGRYDSSLVLEEGCPSGQDPPLDWANGPLEIDGEASALTFAFEGLTLNGAIEKTFTWWIADSAELGPWTLDISAEGLAYIVDDLWVLKGDVTLEAASDGDTCSLTGFLKARE